MSGKARYWTIIPGGETVCAADRPAASGEGTKPAFRRSGGSCRGRCRKKPEIGSGTGGAAFSIKPDMRESAPFHVRGMPLIEPLEYSEEASPA